MGKVGEIIVDSVSEEAIERAVTELGQAARAGSLLISLKMGEIIVRNLFRGDLDALQPGKPKPAPISRLATRLVERGIPVSKQTLYRSVGVYTINERLLSEGHVGLNRLDNLHVSHLYPLLSLPWVDQKALILRIQEHALTTNEVVWAVRSLRPIPQKQRSSMPVFARSIRSFRRYLDDANAFGDLERLEDLKEDDREEIQALVLEMQEKLDEVSRVLFGDA